MLYKQPPVRKQSRSISIWTKLWFRVTGSRERGENMAENSGNFDKFKETIVLREYFWGCKLGIKNTQVAHNLNFETPHPNLTDCGSHALKIRF